MVPSLRVYPRTWMVAPLGLDVGVSVVIADMGAVDGVAVGPGDGVGVSVGLCSGILAEIFPRGSGRNKIFCASTGTLTAATISVALSR
jgi:hypothetical protein